MMFWQLKKSWLTVLYFLVSARIVVSHSNPSPNNTISSSPKLMMEIQPNETAGHTSTPHSVIALLIPQNYDTDNLENRNRLLREIERYEKFSPQKLHQDLELHPSFTDDQILGSENKNISGDEFDEAIREVFSNKTVSKKKDRKNSDDKFPFKDTDASATNEYSFRRQKRLPYKVELIKDSPEPSENLFHKNQDVPGSHILSQIYQNNEKQQNIEQLIQSLLESNSRSTEDKNNPLKNAHLTKTTTYNLTKLIDRNNRKIYLLEKKVNFSTNLNFLDSKDRHTNYSDAHSSSLQTIVDQEDKQNKPDYKPITSHISSSPFNSLVRNKPEEHPFITNKNAETDQDNNLPSGTRTTKIQDTPIDSVEKHPENNYIPLSQSANHEKYPQEDFVGGQFIKEFDKPDEIVGSPQVTNDKKGPTDFVGGQFIEIDDKFINGSEEAIGTNLRSKTEEGGFEEESTEGQSRMGVIVGSLNTDAPQTSLQSIENRDESVYQAKEINKSDDVPFDQISVLGKPLSELQKNSQHEMPSPTQDLVNKLKKGIAPKLKDQLGSNDSNSDLSIKDVHEDGLEHTIFVGRTTTSKPSSDSITYSPLGISIDHAQTIIPSSQESIVFKTKDDIAEIIVSVKTSSEDTKLDEGPNVENNNLQPTEKSAFNLSESIEDDNFLGVTNKIEPQTVLAKDAENNKYVTEIVGSFNTETNRKASRINSGGEENESVEGYMDDLVKFSTTIKPSYGNGNQLENSYEENSDDAFLGLTTKNETQTILAKDTETNHFVTEIVQGNVPYDTTESSTSIDAVGESTDSYDNIPGDNIVGESSNVQPSLIESHTSRINVLPNEEVELETSSGTPSQTYENENITNVVEDVELYGGKNISKEQHSGGGDFRSSPLDTQLEKNNLDENTNSTEMNLYGGDELAELCIPVLKKKDLSLFDLISGTIYLEKNGTKVVLSVRENPLKNCTSGTKHCKLYLDIKEISKPANFEEESTDNSHKISSYSTKNEKRHITDKDMKLVKTVQKNISNKDSRYKRIVSSNQKTPLSQQRLSDFSIEELIKNQPEIEDEKDYLNIDDHSLEKYRNLEHSMPRRFELQTMYPRPAKTSLPKTLNHEKNFPRFLNYVRKNFSNEANKENTKKDLDSGEKYYNDWRRRLHNTFGISNKKRPARTANQKKNKLEDDEAETKGCSCKNSILRSPNPIPSHEHFVGKRVAILSNIVHAVKDWVVDTRT